MKGLAAVCVIGLWAAGVAEAGVRSPQIGCLSRGLIAPTYKPAGCELDADPASSSPALLGLAHLSHVRWSHWGARTATGTGKITYCGTGCSTLAVRVQAFGLLGPHNPRICALDASAYSRLRVRTRLSAYVYNVTPQDAGC